MSEVQPGDVYKMTHSRKGTATVRVIRQIDEWIDVEVIDGRLKGMGRGSLKEAGDQLRVRASLVTFA